MFFVPDPYVKVWLMFGDKRVEKKKTPIYKCNLNPIFNATFEFDVPWEQIRDCALDVQVPILRSLCVIVKHIYKCFISLIEHNYRANSTYMDQPGSCRSR